ncbi:MAG: ABC transporter ATP-binding protein [Methylobacteriaceae bacterium]|nr:ABC transporter ATP-binding protein [Methylobacteriaceae bacterium]
MTTPALAIDNLRIVYPREDEEPFVAVDGVSLSIAPGEIHAVVGESGAGKSTVANAIIGLIDKPGFVDRGAISVGGRPLGSEGARLGRDIGVIFQDPMTSLNPLFTIESQLGEAMRFHLGVTGRQARARSLELMRAVGIPEPERRLSAYPHQLSGGQRQRVVIAAALSCDPKLLIADEPTTALDVSIQAQILKLIRDLADQRGLGVLLVTHNMGVVAEIADSVTVMYRGAAVEQGPVGRVLTAPQAAYSQQLLAAVPRISEKLRRFAVLSQEDEQAGAARRRIAADYGAGRRGGQAPLLEVRDLVVEFRSGGLLGPPRVFRAVDQVSFSIAEGEVLGLVGESGCGKTTTANVVAGLVRPTAGEARLAGALVAGKGARRPDEAGRILQMVFQDPYSSLNPRLRVGRMIAEPILHHAVAASREDAAAQTQALLEAVGLSRESAQRYAFAFSGGQRQRISIARALGPRPQLLICDEPTSSLDVSVQAQILNLLKDLKDQTGLAMLFVSHDLAVIRQMCDRVAVMQAGRIVELADADRLFEAPRHDYTRNLSDLIPRVENARARAEGRSTWQT